ncbi:MAG: anti-sigma factor [Roseiflexaceae bacterium]|nr:anti-sigma factor [Roseiflexaceae bacterium]
MTDWHDLIPAYALGALDPDETIQIEQHLRVDASLRAELDRFRAVVNTLPLAIEPAGPPARVKAALFAKIAASAVQPEAAYASRALLRPRQRWAVGLGGAFVAALLVIALLSSALYSANTQLQQAKATNQQILQQVAAAQEQATAAAQTIGDLQRAQQQIRAELASARTNEQRLAASLIASTAELQTINAQIEVNQDTLVFLAATDLATRPLLASVGDRNAQGSMFMRPGRADAVVLVRGLPQLDQSQTYQFWLAQGGQQVNAGTLIIDPDGTGRLLLKAPASVDTFTQAMVTVERNASVSLPSTRVVLQGSLS